MAAFVINGDTYLFNILGSARFKVFKWNGTDLLEIASLQLPNRPVSLAVSRDAKKAYLGIATGAGPAFSEIDVVDLTNPTAPALTGQVLPYGGLIMDIRPQGDILLIRALNSVYAATIAGQLVWSMPAPAVQSTMLRIEPTQGNIAYIADNLGNLIKLTGIGTGSPASLTIQGPGLPFFPYDGVFHPSGKWLYVSSWPAGANIASFVLKVDTAANTASGTGRALPLAHYAIALNAGTNRVYLTGAYNATLLHTYSIDNATGDLAFTARLGFPVSSIVSPFALAVPSAPAPIATDSIAPVTTANPSPSANASLWNNTSVTAALQATDSGGSGVKEIHFTLSGAQSGSGVVSAESASVSITTEGITTLTYWAIDNAGNAEVANTLIIRIDTTPPAIAASAPSTLPNSNGWNKTNVTLNWTCADSLSGVQSTNASQTLSSEGANQSATGTCTDLAGNTSSNTQRGVNIDKTPPTFNLPGAIAADATSPLGAAISYSASATDNLDPSPTITCSPGSGSVFPIGITNVNCATSDKAGNLASVSPGFQVTVGGASDQVAALIALLNSFNLGVGGNSFAAKLSNIQSAIHSGQNACGQLGAFINEVAAQSGKKLTVAQANQLTAAANRIKAVLGVC
jgi:hypothetical protein